MKQKENKWKSLRWFFVLQEAETSSAETIITIEVLFLSFMGVLMAQLL